MAQVVDASKNLVRLDNGQTVNAQTGGWYDGQQYWGGSLSAPGQFNAQNNQPGQQGQAYVAPENQAYIQQQQAKYQPPANQQPAQPSQPTQPTQQTSTGTPADLSQVFEPATIDLPQIYNDLTATSGVSNLEQQLNTKREAFNTALSKINDNPYYSEATRVGRVAKLQDQFNNDTKALTDQIAMKKADVETQLNLQSKQFDINSQQAKYAFDQFTSLLSAGALDNVSGETIASITKATGLSSDMIQSAIGANKQKNLQTSIQSYDDGTNQGFVVINSQTGEIINRQVVAQSEPKSTGGGTAGEREAEQLNAIRDDLISEARSGATWDSLFRLGLGFLDSAEIYNIYQAYGIYNPSSDDRKNDLAKYGIK